MVRARRQEPAPPTALEQILEELRSRPEAWVAVPDADADPPFRMALNVTGVAAVLGVAPGSVVQFRASSKAGRLPAGTPPFPAEDGKAGPSPYWWPERAAEFPAWQAARPGRGAGGGAGKHRKRTGAEPAERPAGGDTLPRYRVIAEDLRRRIADGEFAEGERVPSVMQLARQHGVSSTTVQQAMLYLNAQGVTESRRGRGNFVAIQPKRRTSSS